MKLAIIKEKLATIVSVERVQSTGQYVRQQAWMQQNKVKDTILVFHGTKHENVDKIVQGGFDERQSIRCAWGKGIYAAASLEDATEYSEPKVTEEGLVQCVIVAQLAFGPVAVGTRGQTDDDLWHEKRRYTCHEP
jgi:hypothetical protein